MKRDKGNPTINDPDPRYALRDSIGNEWGTAHRKDLIKSIVRHKNDIKRYLLGELKKSDLPRELRDIATTKDKFKKNLETLRNSPEYKDFNQNNPKYVKKRRNKSQKLEIRKLLLEELKRDDFMLNEQELPDWLHDEITSKGSLENWAAIHRRKIKDE